MDFRAIAACQAHNWRMDMSGKPDVLYEAFAVIARGPLIELEKWAGSMNGYMYPTGASSGAGWHYVVVLPKGVTPSDLPAGCNAEIMSITAYGPP
jgi:hypothetical protein